MSVPAEPGRCAVRVFHNLMIFSPPGRYPSGYRAGDRVVQVFATTVPAGSDHLAVCEEMFRLLNVGDDPAFGTIDGRAVSYRARGNRSLSVGDLVCVDDAWYACAPVGFVPTTEPPRVVTATAAGSTPYTGVDHPQLPGSPSAGGA